jgi:thiol-disulfide isomerase/thioredoxin
MRTFCLLLSLLCFSGIVRSQIPPTETAPEEAGFDSVYARGIVPKVTGKLLGVGPEVLKSLKISYTVVTPFPEMQVRKTTTANADGSFALQLDYALPYQQIWFSVGDYFYAGIYASKDLYLELDMKKIIAAKEVDFNGDGVRYLGTDGPLTTYLNNYVLYRRDDQLRLSDEMNKQEFNHVGSGDSVLSRYAVFNDSLKMIEDGFIAANPSPYGWILENERMSDYYGRICVFYWYKTMGDSLWQKVRQHKAFLVSNNGAGFYSYMRTYISMMPGDQKPFRWKDIEKLPNLSAREKSLVDSLADGGKMQPAPPYTPENIKRWSASLNARVGDVMAMNNLDRAIHRIDSLFPPAKADFMKLGLIATKDPIMQKAGHEHILQTMQTNWCVSVERNEYRKALEKVDEINKTLAEATTAQKGPESFGKPVLETNFGASLYTASDIKATDFLIGLKKRFPGKAIIIDLWATWCGACLGEMQHSKDLQEVSGDLPVVFVYLCTVNGSSEEKWKEKIVELKQLGVHILIDNALDAELAHYFSFSGYPGHAFIDKTGQYRPGAISWMSQIQDKKGLVALIDK